MWTPRNPVDVPFAALAGAIADLIRPGDCNDWERRFQPDSTANNAASFFTNDQPQAVNADLETVDGHCAIQVPWFQQE